MNQRHTSRGLSVFALFSLVLSASILGISIHMAGQSVQKMYDEAYKQEASRKIVVPNRKIIIPNVSEPLAKQKKSELASPAGKLALINKQRPISKDYVPAELTLPTVPYRKDKTQEEASVRSELVEPLKQMFGAAEKDGLKLMIASAYRSAKLQQTYFDNYVKASGVAEAERYSAHPGHSEHQTGLAVDISTEDQRCYLNECFIGLNEGMWLSKNAYKYGFILRYDRSKENITGYMYEPWHYRYLGKEVAKAVFESGLTYEEFYPYLTGEKKAKTP